MKQMNSRLLLTIVLVITTTCTFAQGKPNIDKPYVPVSKALYDTIAHMDSVLFNSFNSRDLETQKKVFAQDVEFYHDKGGLMNYETVIRNTGVLFDRNDGLQRTLIPGSMEVYPIEGYGAVQIGAHRFCHKEKGKDDCGTFKFIHVWQKRPDGWKLTRVISYDH